MGRYGEALSKIDHSNVSARYIEEFRDDGMSREIVGAVWACYKVDGTDLKVVPLLVKQRVFRQKLESDLISDVPDRLDNVEDNWEFEGVVILKEVATFGISR